MKKPAIFAALLLMLALIGCWAPPVVELSQGAGQNLSESPKSQSGQIETASPEDADSSFHHPMSREIRVRLTFEGGEAMAVLIDNPSTQSLLEQLPVTLTMEDFADAEKIAYFPKSLSQDGAPKGYDPAPGDIACYGPWGNLAVFYGDQPYTAGLIPMGTIESGLGALSAQEAGFGVVFQMMHDMKEETS
ncbi:MAG: cyclophilin-like fold protein [Christensenellales bacterium]|jgi:hypothetical protein